MDTEKGKKKKLPFNDSALRKKRAAEKALAQAQTQAASSSPPLPSTDSSDVKKQNDNDEHLDLFRRSRDMARLLEADREKEARKRQKKKKQAGLRKAGKRTAAEKRRLDAEEDEDDQTIPLDDATTPGEANEDVQDVSGAEVEDKDDAESTLATPPPSKRARTNTASSRRSVRHASSPTRLVDDSPSTRRAVQIAGTSPAQIPSQSASENVICIDSDEEGDTEPSVPSQPKLSRRDDSEVRMLDDAEDPEPEEDEFAEYLEKAARARKQAEAASTAGGKKIFEVLIVSNIEGTRSCLVRMYCDMTLTTLPTQWFTVQEKHGIDLPPDFTPQEAILTWRGVLAYPHTTLLGLGIRPYGDTRLITKYGNSKGLTQNDTRVLMELWTPEGFKKCEEEERARKRREAGNFSDDEDAQDLNEEPVTLKINVVARDSEPCRLTVRPETTIDTVITAFRRERNLGSNREVTLWFDGEMLEEHVTMDEAEIDDMDTIEAHVK